MRKRLIAAVLTIISLFFSGCGEGEKLEAEFEKARSLWQTAESIGFTAEVTAELHESVFQCSLSCKLREGETLIEILSPENISGIRARLREGEGQIEYDGLILAVGDPMKGDISPISAMPMIMTALLEGYGELFWNEKRGEQEFTATQIYVDENSSMKLWFEKENFNLSYAELVSGGRAVVKCKITDFAEE